MHLGSRRRMLSAAFCVVTLVALIPAAIAQSPPIAIVDAGPGPEAALTQKIAVLRFDALGIDTELVIRLEALFRSELERLAKQPITPRREFDALITGPLRDCSGENKCLAAIGKKLKADVVITGTVGAAGENYVLSIKAVNSQTGEQIRRISSDPLRGSPDELIDAVRVAAYRLLAPEQLYGGMVILCDVVGGTVLLDGKAVGKTPLAVPLSKLPLGPHQLRVEAPGYAAFEEPVDVRFQKNTRIVVRLVADNSKPIELPPLHKEQPHWYGKTWVIVGIGVASVLVGVVAGSALAGKKIVCTQGQRC
jgi:hypothetical protein